MVGGMGSATKSCSPLFIVPDGPRGMAIPIIVALSPAPISVLPLVMMGVCLVTRGGRTRPSTSASNDPFSIFTSFGYPFGPNSTCAIPLLALVITNLVSSPSPSSMFSPPFSIPKLAPR